MLGETPGVRAGLILQVALREVHLIAGCIDGELSIDSTGRSRWNLRHSQSELIEVSGCICPACCGLRVVLGAVGGGVLKGGGHGTDGYVDDSFAKSAARGSCGVLQRYKEKINIRHLPMKILLNGTLVLWYFGTFCYFLCDNCR